MLITASMRAAAWRLGVSSVFVLFLAVIPVRGQGGLEDIDPFADAPAPQEPADEGLAIPGFADEVPLPGLDDPSGTGEPETRESILAAARQFAQNEEWINVLSELGKNQNPRDGEFALERAKAFLALGDKQLAISDFDVAATYGAPFPGVQEAALKNLGELRLEAGQIQEAVDDLTQAVRLNPTNSELLALRGKALVRLVRLLGVQGAEQLQDAKDTLQRAIDADPNNAQAHFERSNVYLLRNDYDKALADLELAVEKDSESVEIKGRAGLAHLGRAANERVRYDADLDQVASDYLQANNYFDQFLASEGAKTKDDYEDADPELLTAGQVYLYRGISEMGLANNSSVGDKTSLYQSSIADFDQVLKFDPDTGEALYQKAVAQRMSGDLAGAIVTLSDVLALAPEFAEARLRRGICYYYLDELLMARGDFEQCLDSMSDGRAPFWIGVTYARVGQYADAIRYYTQSIRENPQYKPAYSNRGLAYAKLERHEQAIEDYNELIRRDRNDTVALERRAKARAALGF